MHRSTSYPLLAFVVLAAGVAAGCVFSPNYDQTGYRCETGECPDGQKCVAGVCVPVGTVVRRDAGAGEPDAPPVPPPDASPPDAGPPNLVANGDMEMGLTGWTGYLADLRETTNHPHGGAKAIVVCKQAAMATSFFSVYADAVQAPGAGTLTKGAHYVASVWVRASFAMAETPPPKIQLVLREHGGAVMPLDHVGTSAAPITTDWVMMTADAVIDQADRTLLTFDVEPDDSPDGTCFAVDDAVLNLVP